MGSDPLPPRFAQIATGAQGVRPHLPKGSPRAPAASHDRSRANSERSDQILLDLLAGVLLGLEPARHPAAPRPCFVRLGIAELGLHLAPASLSHGRAIAATIGVEAGTAPPLRSSIA